MLTIPESCKEIPSSGRINKSKIRKARRQLSVVWKIGRELRSSWCSVTLSLRCTWSTPWPFKWRCRMIYAGRYMLDDMPWSCISKTWGCIQLVWLKVNEDYGWHQLWKQNGMKENRTTKMLKVLWRSTVLRCQVNIRVRLLPQGRYGTWSYVMSRFRILAMVMETKPAITLKGNLPNVSRVVVILKSQREERSYDTLYIHPNDVPRKFCIPRED